MNISIEGSVPLLGSVKVAGTKNSAMKLIIAALYTNFDVVLDNVPRLESVNIDIEIIKSLGVKVEWIGSNRLLINASAISSFEIPQELGSKYRSTFLLAGPLLFRFGKAILPKYVNEGIKLPPINRILGTWQSLGIEIKEDVNSYSLSLGSARAADVSFKTSSHTGTDNAILSSLYLDGETTISNASEEPEVDDLIKFCNEIGGHVERTQPRKIKISGTNIFKGASFEVMPDKNEAVFFASAALVTKGNIVIENITKASLTPYVNYLAKLGADFEISDTELRVWRTKSDLEAINLNVSPSPGFVPDWQPLSVIVATQAVGESLVHDTVFTDRFGYIRDLNRMGAKIELTKPSELGIIPIISEDEYDFKVQGEPATVAKISGPTKLKAEKIHVSDARFSDAYVLAALCADGKSEILDYSTRFATIENLTDKLLALGAKLQVGDLRP